VNTEAIVVLPDHLYAVWKLPDDDFNYSLRWHQIKSYLTKSLIHKGLQITKDQRGEYHLWQRCFWENEYMINQSFKHILIIFTLTLLKMDMYPHLRTTLFQCLLSQCVMDVNLGYASYLTHELSGGMLPTSI